jgi:hypothetical protein
MSRTASLPQSTPFPFQLCFVIMVCADNNQWTVYIESSPLFHFFCPRSFLCAVPSCGLDRIPCDMRSPRSRRVLSPHLVPRHITSYHVRSPCIRVLLSSSTQMLAHWPSMGSYDCAQRTVAVVLWSGSDPVRSALELLLFADVCSLPSETMNVGPRPR